MLLHEWNLKDAVAYAEERGEMRGEKRGEKRNALKIAKRMKDDGKSIDEIIRMTDLTVDDILRL